MYTFGYHGFAMSPEGVHYWLANVPQDQWSKECPDFLTDISERDRQIVGTLDKDFCRLTWPEVKQAVGMVGHHKSDRYVID